MLRKWQAEYAATAAKRMLDGWSAPWYSYMIGRPGYINNMFFLLCRWPVTGVPDSRHQRSTEAQCETPVTHVDIQKRLLMFVGHLLS